MTIDPVQQNVGSVKPGISDTVTLPALTAAGNLLTAEIAIRSGATGNVSKIEDAAGNIWALGDVGFYAGSSTRVAIWYAENAQPVTEILVTLDQSKEFATNFAEWPIQGAGTFVVGNNASNPVGSPQITHLSGLVTVPPYNCLVIGAVNTPNTELKTLQNPADWTALWDFATVGGSSTSNANGTAAYRVASDVTTEATWTLANARNYGGATVVFRIPATAPPDTTPPEFITQIFAW